MKAIEDNEKEATKKLEEIVELLLPVSGRSQLSDELN